VTFLAESVSQACSFTFPDVNATADTNGSETYNGNKNVAHDLQVNNNITIPGITYQYRIDEDRLGNTYSFKVVNTRNYVTVESRDVEDRQQLLLVQEILPEQVQTKPVLVMERAFEDANATSAVLNVYDSATATTPVFTETSPANAAHQFSFVVRVPQEPQYAFEVVFLNGTTELSRTPRQPVVSDGK